MKKYLYIGLMALLAMPLMMSCKDKNPADNPNENKWSDEEPGSTEWFEDLITGEDTAKIVNYSDADMVGIWRCVAFIETDKEGNILRSQDYILTSEIERGGMQFYMALWENHESVYYRHLMMNGYPVLEESEGTWQLQKSSVRFKDKMIPNTAPYNDPEHFKIDFLERERLVLSQECINDKNEHCVYYEVWQREQELPKIDTKLPIDRMLETSWKVIADTLAIDAWNSDPKTGTTTDQKIFVKETGVFAGCSFRFKKDSTFSVTDKAGKSKTYKWRLAEYSEPTYVSFTVIELGDKWPSPITYYTVWLPSNETTMKLMGSAGERLPEAEVPKGFEDAALFQDIFLDPVK